ncbi:ABC transporter substrate-binding protein [Limobrevibacterium gyesilva]|uniref:ABC transporter substrate-binding protein n=1 Tax=Limobrevibacterium gyesilva TaxID=2991712 RepID=A0AA41YIR1_9PROT|nr:ABC transporter substrate-binding protein [Limobrevibacterium gyesilva]MCW3474359.1 ABC transporter substrate-binding protein [Limobrevibacterium gyesilva]
MVDLSRRTLLQTAAVGALAGAMPAQAAEADGVTIGWPSDVTSWDPNQRFTPDAQAIFKMVFDQPLDQDPKLKLVANLVSKWEMAADARSLKLEFRDDVLFHNGDRMTSADFRWTFFERIKAGHKVDIAQSFRKVTDIETPTPTTAIMRFDSPAPTVPVWLAFLGSFMVPKAYMEKVGVEGFSAKPVGTGPYKLAEYQLNARIVLERNDAYWGPKPKLRRVTIEIIKDPSARVAAVQSGQVDITVGVPVREVARLKAMPNLAAELNPITRVILLQVRNDEGFADQNIRLAAHHAIDKKALSQAFYAGAAVPLSVPATPGSPGYLDDYSFAYDPELAKQLLAKSGFGPDKPAKIRMASTNGQFPSDYDMARAIVQMWKKVGIEATLEVIEYAKYFELNRGNKLPEATLYSFDNATGDPEIYTGYLLNPKLPFSPWKDMGLGQKVIDQFNVADETARIAGWRALNREAAEMGATLPLLQSVQTLVRKKSLNYTPYGNGWLLGQTMSWS